MIITVIVLCVIVCLNPFNAFALVSYETNATDTNGVYEVVDNGVTINTATKEIYRENAPDPTKVTQQVYNSMFITIFHMITKQAMISKY